MDLSARVYGPSSIRSPFFKSLLIGCAPMEPNLALFIYPPNVVISRFSNRNVLETALELGLLTLVPTTTLSLTQPPSLHLQISPALLQPIMVLAL